MNFVSHSLIVTSKMLPLLLVIYVVIGLMEYRYSDRLYRFVGKLGMWGPLAGALCGCLPQCGFSVVMSALYVRRLISVGTLLAVYLSTSDEAIPVLLSMSRQAHIVGLLIFIKVSIAIVTGMVVDFLIHRHTNTKKFIDGVPVDRYCQKTAEEHHGCCDHDVTSRPSVLKALIIHPLQHTFKVFIFLFISTLFLSFIVQSIGVYKISKLFLEGSIFQPSIAAIIGLIPNCFSSVFLVQLFNRDILSFGALIAGLCSASGLGLLVLIRENKNFKDTLFIVSLLVGVSIFAGTIIQCGGK